MVRAVEVLIAAALALAVACGDNGPTAPQDPLTGSWSGKFSNGIPITVALTLTGSTLTGKYNAGSDSGTVSGSYGGSAFAFQFTAVAGTQRTLSNPALVNNYTRITANWDDGAGLSGTLCLAKSGATACP